MNIELFMSGYLFEKKSVSQINTPTTVWQDVKKNLVDQIKPFEYKSGKTLNSPKPNFKIESTNSSNDVSKGMQ